MFEGVSGCGGGGDTLKGSEMDEDWKNGCHLEEHTSTKKGHLKKKLKKTNFKQMKRNEH